MSDPTTGVTVIDPRTVIVTLTDYPESQYNRLIPTQTIVLPSDLFVPVFRAVELDPADREGKSADHYKSSDIPNGHRALTARGLAKLADAAQVSFFDERRLDDGTVRDVLGVAVIAAMKLPSGDWRTWPGSQLIDLRTWFSGSASEAEKAKFRKQFWGNVRTRARSNAIRGLLSLRQSYPDRDIAKPFVVATYDWNYNHPQVRERALERLAPSIQAAFGPSAQLGAGAGTRLLAAPEIPIDDEPVAAPQPLTAARAPRADTGSAPAAPAAPGASTAPVEPDWITGGSAAAAAEATSAPTLADIVAERLADEGQPKGAVTEDQGRRLGEIFADLGEQRKPLVRGGIRVLFGVEAEALTCAHARAIGMAHDELGHAAFLQDWAELAS